MIKIKHVNCHVNCLHHASTVGANNICPVHINTKKGRCYLPLLLRYYLLICFITIPLYHSAFALEDDKNQPISIQADSVFIDNKVGKSQYEGNVSVQNGSTHLTATKAIVYTTKENSIQEADAFGNDKTQAHYWTTTDLKKPALNAYADTIRIFPDKHMIYLIGHAKVSQGDDFYQAPRIEYNSETQHVFSPQSNKGRTTIVIHPQQSPSTENEKKNNTREIK